MWLCDCFDALVCHICVKVELTKFVSSLDLRLADSQKQKTSGRKGRREKAAGRTSTVLRHSVNVFFTFLHLKISADKGVPFVH